MMPDNGFEKVISKKIKRWFQETRLFLVWPKCRFLNAWLSLKLHAFPVKIIKEQSSSYLLFLGTLHLNFLVSWLRKILPTVTRLHVTTMRWPVSLILFLLSASVLFIWFARLSSLKFCGVESSLWCFFWNKQCLYHQRLCFLLCCYQYFLAQLGSCVN